MCKKQMKGQTLIEVVVAVGAAVVIITALTTLIINSVNNGQISRNQNLATQYASEGIEDMRQIRDVNYATFAAYNGVYCLGPSNPPVLSPACSTANLGNPLTFLRTVTITPNRCGEDVATNMSNVVVTVAWNDGKCATETTYCHSSQVSSCLSTVSPNVGP